MHQSYQSHNAPAPYTTILHFGTEMCTFLFQSGVLWDMAQMHCGLVRLFMHYTDVIMTTMASQITSLTVVYSTVYSDADQRIHQSSTSLAFVWGIHRDRWIPRTKGQLRGKCFHLMTSSCMPSPPCSCSLWHRCHPTFGWGRPDPAHTEGGWWHLIATLCNNATQSASCALVVGVRGWP